MDMHGTEVSRVLFGFTAAFHFLFVPLTIGLMGLIAAMDGLRWWRRDACWSRASRFFGKFFLVNFAFGIATGWPLRYQLAEHWTGYMAFAADLTRPVFAIEGALAPVLFGLVALFALRMRFAPRVRFAISTALALVLIAQSIAILALNAWMQLPVGVNFVGDRPVLDDPLALFANPLLPWKVVHTIGAAYVLGGGFVTAVSAWYLLRGRHLSIAQRCFPLAASTTLAAVMVTGLAGHGSGQDLARWQPMKFAAIEALWRTEAPTAFVVAAWPDTQARENRYELRIPGLLGWLAGETPEQPLRGLDDLGDLNVAAGGKLPPVAAVFWLFRVMVGSALLLGAVMFAAVLVRPRADSRAGRAVLWACVLALPLPWIATEAGWLVCEMGRQPWTVTGLLPTARAGSAIGSGDVALKLLGHVAVAALLLAGNLAWSVWRVRRGPVDRPVRASLGRHALTDGLQPPTAPSGAAPGQVIPATAIAIPREPPRLMAPAAGSARA